MPKQLVIISKFFLPHESVDSTSVYKMITEILKLNSKVEIHVITSDNTYKGKVTDATKDPNGVLNKISVHRVKFSESHASSMGILFSGIILGYKLVKKAKSLKIKNIVSLSNPPLIAMWCTILLRKFNLFYWTFDLFPDAFAADELISRQNPIFRLFEWLTYSNPPSTLICLGDYQYSYVSRKFNSTIPYIKLPCGVHQDKPLPQEAPDWHSEDAIIVGYVGNMGRAHSLPFLLNVISEVANLTGYVLVLAIYGHHKDAVTTHVGKVNAKNIVLVDFIKKEHLSFIDIHMVSLKQSWNNLSVPSKAVSGVCSGGVLWFCGPVDSDTGKMFKGCSYNSDEEIVSVRNTLKQISIIDIMNKKEKCLQTREDLIKFEYIAYKDIISKLS